MGVKVDTMNVSLPPAMKARVEKIVDAGEFTSVSEIVRAAMSDWLKAWEERELKLAWFRAEIDKGRAQLDRGEGILYESVDDLFDEIEQNYQSKVLVAAPKQKRTSRKTSRRSANAKN